MDKKLIAVASVLLLSCPTFVVAFPYQEKLNNQTDSPSRNDILTMINQIDEDLIFSYHHRLMQYGVRYTGSINCTMAGQYIYNAFTDMGLEAVIQEWRFDSFHSTNVIATLPGTDPESTGVFIVSAHFDTVPGSPGADDDGSGVGTVLALASVMSGHSFNHTIRFIAFSGEEVGTFGSFCYARDIYGNGDNIIAVLNVDMVGYADSTDGGKILRFFPPERSHWIAEYATTIAEKYNDLLDMSIETLPNYIGADHQAFVDYGYDGVWISHHDGYPWGHSPNDTADHLNWTYYTKATQLMCAILGEFALKPIPVQVILRTPMEGTGYFFNKPVLKLDLGKLWYARLRGTTLLLGRAVASADVITNEPIRFVIFCIDGNFMLWDSEPPYEWKIQGLHWPPIGRHTLKVYAYTVDGDIASDQMDILIYTLSYAYGPRNR